MSCGGRSYSIFEGRSRRCRAQDRSFARGVARNRAGHRAGLLGFGANRPGRPIRDRARPKPLGGSSIFADPLPPGASPGWSVADAHADQEVAPVAAFEVSDAELPQAEGVAVEGARRDDYVPRAAQQGLDGEGATPRRLRGAEVQQAVEVVADTLEIACLRGRYQHLRSAAPATDEPPGEGRGDLGASPPARRPQAATRPAEGNALSLGPRFPRRTRTWLATNSPGIQVMCRDGSGGFAQAVTDTDPAIVLTPG